jgi:hypothetical protein
VRSPAVTNQELTEQDHRLILDLGAIWRFVNQRTSGSWPHAQSRTGRCIPRLQIYRMSAPTDRLLVWRSIRCDAPGTEGTLNTLGLKTSPGRSTRRGSRSSPRVSARPRDNSFPRCKDETYLMRLRTRSGSGTNCCYTSLKLTRLGSRRTRLS